MQNNIRLTLVKSLLWVAFNQETKTAIPTALQNNIQEENTSNQPIMFGADTNSVDMIVAVVTRYEALLLIKKAKLVSEEDENRNTQSDKCKGRMTQQS